MSICRSGSTSLNLKQSCGELSSISSEKPLKLNRQTSSDDIYQNFSARMFSIKENSEQNQFRINAKEITGSNKFSDFNIYFNNLINNLIFKKVSRIYNQSIVNKETITIQDFCFISEVYLNENLEVKKSIIDNLISNVTFDLKSLIPIFERLKNKILEKEMQAQAVADEYFKLMQSNQTQLKQIQLKAKEHFLKNTKKLNFTGHRLKYNLEELNNSFPSVKEIIITQGHSGKYNILQAIINKLGNSTFNNINLIPHFTIVLLKRKITPILWKEISPELSGGNYYKNYFNIINK